MRRLHSRNCESGGGSGDDDREGREKKKEKKKRGKKRGKKGFPAGVFFFFFLPGAFTRILFPRRNERIK